MTPLALAADMASAGEPGCRFRHFTRWTPDLIAEYHRVESSAFRRELRYTPRELEERAGRPGFEGLLVEGDRGPEAVVLVARGASPRTLYLDTLAVRVPGRGLGTRLLRALLRAAGAAGCDAVDLDTEWTSERGQSLVEYYRKLGFRVVESDGEDGNVSMTIDLD